MEPSHNRGEVHFQVNLDGTECTVRICDCLHAPDIPINLFLVGAMQEKDLVLVFGSKLTMIHLPWTMTEHDGLTIEATFMHRLSFLHCKFLLPPNALSLVSIADPAAPLHDDPPVVSPPRVPANLDLWHFCVSHLGMEATKELLTKSYATGITFDGDLMQHRCIPCLIGKCPQQSFSHLRHHASKVCKLLHMDTCGPFPVTMPFGTSMFLVILDDFLNLGHTDLMVKKSDAFQCYLAVEARWEQKSGNKVLTL